VALASEEAHEPHITVPRGLVLAQLTLVVMVILTWFFASAAAPYRETGAVDYPLPLVLKKVWGTGWLLKTFSGVALAGVAVSYCGIFYATSRQAFSLGRAGYLPRSFGKVHATRRTPHVSLIACTAITIAFIVFGYFHKDATNVAILISTLTAVIWYVLAMACLLVLRRNEPGLFRPYQTPVFPWLVVFVGLLAAFAGYLYAWVNVQVIVPTAGLYLTAALWYALRGRHTVLPAAPEEVAARIAQKLILHEQGAGAAAAAPEARTASPRQSSDYITALVLLAGLLSLVWMVARATKLFPGEVGRTEVAIVGTIWGVLFLLVSLVGLQSTKPRN
jgi:amino acid transporter